MNFDEIIKKMKAAVEGVRKAIYGVEVREYIARGLENVLAVGQITVDAAKAAQTSETNAKASENAAADSVVTAGQIAEEAADSAAKAKTSETNAAASEQAAQTSETNAKKSEEAAKKYAGDAAAIANTDKTLTIANAAADAAATGVRLRMLEMIQGVDVEGISFVSAFDTLEGVALEGLWNKAASRVEF